MIVDGAQRPGTAYTLSHWPGTPTPPAFAADLSAEIARNALAHRHAIPAEPRVASIDHYDADGLVALALLVLDGLDAEHGPLLVEAARVGDFDVVTDHSAALVAFALNALDDSERGSGCTVAPSARPADAFAYCGVLAQRALDVLFDLAAHPEGFESLWGDEFAAYESSVRALTEGGASIEEFADQDLAVVRVDPQFDTAPTSWEGASLHRAAVHSATDRLRVATVAGGAMELRYRYESWVRLATRRPRLRVDLDRLAFDLTAAEKHAAQWTFDGARSITGALHLVGDDATSTLDPEQFVEMVRGQLHTLDQGPPAWDPYSDRSLSSPAE